MVAKKMPNIRVILYMHTTKNIFDRRIERTKNLISKYGNCEWSVVTICIMLCSEMRCIPRIDPIRK